MQGLRHPATVSNQIASLYYKLTSYVQTVLPSIEQGWPPPNHLGLSYSRIARFGTFRCESMIVSRIHGIFRPTLYSANHPFSWLLDLLILDDRTRYTKTMPSVVLALVLATC